jgi:hypothetical protein
MILREGLVAVSVFEPASEVNEARNAARTEAAQKVRRSDHDGREHGVSAFGIGRMSARRGKMEDEIRTNRAERPLCTVAIHKISAMKLKGRQDVLDPREFRPGMNDDVHLAARLEEPANEVRSDEPGGTRHQNAAAGKGVPDHRASGSGTDSRVPITDINAA